RICPTALLMLCAPVWLRSSRFRKICAPPRCSVKRSAKVIGVGRPTYSRSKVSNSRRKDSSAQASAYAAFNSSSGCINVSGTKLPPYKPKCPSVSGKEVKSIRKYQHKLTGQKNTRQKNKRYYFSVLHFPVWSLVAKCAMT